MSNHGDSLGYVHQTDTGWSPPDYLPTLYGQPEQPRIALDSAQRPQVVWYDNLSGHAFYSGWNGSSWTPPEQLDSIGNSGTPTICVDGWNQTHAIVGDGGGFYERVKYQGRLDGELAD